MTSGPVVMHVLWRLSLAGGIPLVVRSLLTMIDEPFRHHVVSLRPRCAEDRLDTFDSIDFTFLDAERPLTLRDRARLARRVEQTARAVRPDIVHVHSGTAWAATTAARHASSRLLEYHDSPQSARASPWTSLATAAQIHTQGYHVVVHSSSVRRDVTRALRVRSDRLHEIPLGIDTTRFSPVGPDAARNVRQRLGLPADRPLIAWVGRLVDSKNPMMALDVARELEGMPNPPVLAIVGSGRLRADVADRVERDSLGATAVLCGRVSEEDLPALFSASDLFLTTSSYEGFGLAAAEALSCGTPVVGLAAGGLTDVVGPGCGTLLDIDADSHELAAAIRDLIENPDRLSRSSAAARTHAEGLSIRSTAEHFEALYASLARNP